MKICIAQTASLKGDIHRNIENHLQIIEHAIKLNSDLIIFPELSITGYEPGLAKILATNIENDIFNSFQELSNKNNISIGIGMPVKALDGINISMLIFQRHKKRIVYTKGILHNDELPYFTSGKTQPILTIKGKKIALGICYETLQRVHFMNAIENGAEIYIASVAKTNRGIDKAYIYFAKLARDFKIPVLMSNAIGYCDNFLSNGQSCVWNKNGILIDKLNTENQGVIVYDTELEEITTAYDDSNT